jgi:hypothetical protein
MAAGFPRVRFGTVDIPLFVTVTAPAKRVATFTVSCAFEAGRENNRIMSEPEINVKYLCILNFIIFFTGSKCKAFKVKKMKVKIIKSFSATF